MHQVMAATRAVQNSIKLPRALGIHLAPYAKEKKAGLPIDYRENPNRTVWQLFVTRASKPIEAVKASDDKVVGTSC
jgi:hypothetical protein